MRWSDKLCLPYKSWGEQANVANSGSVVWWCEEQAGWWEMLYVPLYAHFIYILYWYGSKTPGWAVPASWICTSQCSIFITSPFRPEMHCCVFTFYRIFSKPATFTKQNNLSGLQSEKKLGDGEEQINKQSTKSKEERDKTMPGQRRKEMKLGLCPICAWVDLCSCFTYII